MAEDSKPGTASPNDQSPKRVEGDRRNAAPSISLPKGGGALRSIDEKFTVNPANGTCEFTVPLPFSRTRSGLDSSLALHYNSGSGNSAFGLGWSIPLSSIQRRTDKKLPQYEDATESDVFLFAGSEDLVPRYSQNLAGDWIRHSRTVGAITVERYRPRMEGTFSRIEKITVAGETGFYWKVTSRDNVTTILGRTGAARITFPGDANRIFRWLPEWIYDDKGNCLEFVYKSEDLSNVPHLVEEKNRLAGIAPLTNKYLKRIHYGNTAPYYPNSLKPFDPPPPINPGYLFETVLDYGEHDDAVPSPIEVQSWQCRLDPFSECRSGFEIRSYRLCRRILFFQTLAEMDFSPAPYLVRSLDLTYKNFHFDNSPYISQEADFITAITRVHYKKTAPGTYQRKAWPSVSLTYQDLNWDKTVRTVSPEDVVGAPSGVSRGYQWVDLYSEGVPGILTEQGMAWYYKSNLGDGSFSRAFSVLPKPSLSGVASAALQFQDLNADGTRQVVSLGPPLPGFFELTDENDWLPFRAFEQTLNVDFSDANIKFIDLDGDGKPDLLMTEEYLFRWHPSLGRIGYDRAEYAAKALDEELGPAVLFADGTQTTFIADMNGDGLADIVRIRNGEVCYWPNLGYGRFGAKVNMRNAPQFDAPDKFDPTLVQLGDISGTGAADLIYLGSGGFVAWINLAGNAWSDAQAIFPFPGTEQPNRVSVLDLLGNGTVSIVWSSELPLDATAPLRYADLMGGKKPFVITSYSNNLGQTTKLEYKSSSYYALLDKREGRPWATKLPFPTMCVSRVETSDLVANTLLVQKYRYRHGYYDHQEREFRGFGMVEQTDSESFDLFKKSGANNAADEAVHQPTVRTRTWFHVGAYINNAGILRQFSTDYYTGSAKPEAVLPDAVLEANSPTPEELRQAARACKGMMLRQEVYADDDSLDAAIPYTTSEHNCHTRMLQPMLGNRYAVFISHESEAITYNYERNPSDPRIVHTLNTVIDEFGNVAESASVVYSRQTLDGTLPLEAQAEQGRVRVIYTTHLYTADVMLDSAYRLRLPCETQMFELTGVTPVGSCFTPDEIRTLFTGATQLAFESAPHVGLTEKRLFRHERSLFSKNANVNQPLPFGALDPLGLPYENYRLAFTPTLLNALYAGRVDNGMLAEGKYVKSDDYKTLGLFPSSDADGLWWSRSGSVQYPANPDQHFYLADRFVDPLGATTTVHYFSNYHLLIDRITDSLSNETNVLNFDFRILQPQSVKDINDNIVDVSFDLFGLVVGTAIRGKGNEADDLVGFQPDLAQPLIDAFLADPVTNGPALLKNATTRFVYSFKSLPAVAAGIARETHAQVASATGVPSKIQYAFEYSNGLGQVAMKKVQAEPGKANRCLVNSDGSYSITVVDTSPNLRWVGSGRTVINNKGKTVMQFEPYFSVTPAYENAPELVETGVTPIFFYDPLGRLQRTDFPDGTFSRVVFNAWLQETHDQNDTLLASDWYAARFSGGLGTAEQAAALRTVLHDNTPAVTHTDSLGRSIYAIEHNRFRNRLTNLVQDEFYSSLSTLDIVGNRLALRESRNLLVVQNAYDLLDRPDFTTSMDAGPRHSFFDCMGLPLYRWDAKGNRIHTLYDVLHRPLQHVLLSPSNVTLVYERFFYGTDKTKNQNGKLLIHYDKSGKVSCDAYDFKENLLVTTRIFTTDYKGDIDWSTPGAIPLQANALRSQSVFDALNRVTAITSADGSTTSVRFSEAGLLTGIDVALHGAASQPIITQVTHDARGQRLRVDRINATSTFFDYDPLTFRVRHIRTLPNSGGPSFQDLNYIYDPIGNVTQIRDDAQRTIFFSNQVVSPQNNFTYDAVYRLISATGREHVGQNSPVSEFDEFRTNPPNPTDITALRNYLQQYDYDFSGNLLNIVHSSGTGPFTNRWTRQFFPSPANNRLDSSQVAGVTENYSYDLHGNMAGIPGMPTLDWNFDDQLRSVDLGGGGTAYYTYDGQGNRVRKVVERLGGLKEERLNVGVVEIFTRSQTAAVKLQRWTLHLMDGKQRIALVDSRIVGDDGTPAQLIRFQFSNHLGSATLELDDATQLISYEEYYPFGSTSFQGVDSSRKLPPKRFRFVAKERDEETGLYYCGARYYAPWLGRWTSTDPKGITDGLNVYTYTHNNPINRVDPTGTQDEPTLSPGVGLTINSKGVSFGGIGPYCDEKQLACGGAFVPFQQSKQPNINAYVTLGLPPLQPTANLDPLAGPTAPKEQERTFWSRGGGTTVGGGILLTIGVVLILSNPAGWVVGLTAGMALAGGFVGTTVGVTQLAMSYSGQTTAKQDEETSRAASMAMGLSSPGGMVGGVLGVSITGTQEGLEKGAFWGGLAEAGGTLAYGGGKMLLREIEFGKPASSAWRAARPGIQEAYELGDVAARARPNPAFPGGIERMDLSHWIPQRAFKGSGWEGFFNRPWNIKPMWAGEHALVDPFRLQFIKQPWKAAYELEQLEGLSRQLQLTPPWLLQVGYGAAEAGRLELNKQ